MVKTKIYRILSSFTVVDLNRLGKFVDGPIKQENGKARSLILLMIKTLKADEISLEKEQYWRKIMGPTTYNDVRFRKLCSDGLGIIEHFLSNEAYHKDQLLEASIRLRALSTKELSPLYKTHYSRVKSLLERYPERGSDYYFYRYKTEQNAYAVRQLNLQRFKITNIDDILNQLDVFYIIEKLKYYCEVLSRRTFLKHEYRNRLMDEIIQLIESGEFQEVPLIQIYHQIVRSHLDPNLASHYFALKELLKAHGATLPKTTMKEVYTSALNYCTRKINQGHSDFILEGFEMYKELLYKDLLYDQGALSHWTFKNIVVLALRSGQFEWTGKFIDQYQEFIIPEFRQNAISYNKAQLHFYKKDFGRVLELLQTVEYEDVTYDLGAKSMLIATYYELGEIDALFALADSFKVFIHRRKNIIPENRRRSYLNLIKYTIKLQKIDPKNRAKLDQLLSSISSNEEEIASETWIKEKIRAKRELAPTMSGSNTAS